MRTFVTIAVLACSADADIGKSTYAMSYPFAYKTFMEQYFPTAENIVQDNSTKTCVEWVKLCLDTTACSGPSPEYKQIHSVGAYERDSGSSTMQELEGFFTTALGKMANYDPFMELAVGLHTTDLDYYIKAFDAASPKVPYFPQTFTGPKGTAFHSITVQIPGSLQAGAGSMLLMELIADGSSILSSRENIYHHPVQRFSAESLAQARSKNEKKSVGAASGAKPAITMIKVSFPSSDLARDTKFFEGVLKGTKVFDQSVNGTSIYAGKVLSADTVEVHFVHNTKATQGPMTVAAWETYQTTLHKKCVGTGAGFDRLADNHIGHMGMGDVDPYIANVKAAGLPYRFYKGGPSDFFYFWWPNGWGMQLIGTITGAPTNVTGYNFCTQGITGHCSADLPSDDDEA